MKKINFRNVISCLILSMIINIPSFAFGTEDVLTLPKLKTKHKCTKKKKDLYDFIVVGAGASGGIVASRLAQEGFKVALLEAGQNHNNNFLVQSPAYAVTLWDDPFYQVVPGQGYVTTDAIPPDVVTQPFDELNYHVGNPDGTDGGSIRAGTVSAIYVQPVTPNAGGTGYQIGDTILVGGGNPIGGPPITDPATGVVTAISGTLTLGSSTININPNDPGSGYSVGDVIIISSFTGDEATATVTSVNSSGGITGLNVTSGGIGFNTGSGYVTGDTATFAEQDTSEAGLGGSGTIVSVDGGSIFSCEVTHPGTGYYSFGQQFYGIGGEPLTFTIDSVHGSGAILNGFVNSQAMQQSQYPRGIGLGGSAMHNGMAYARGSPNVYNQWAKLTDDDSWSYEKLLPFFNKFEKQFFIDAPNLRGTEGWLGITKLYLSKISTDLLTCMLQAPALVSQGQIPLVWSFNTVPPDQVLNSSYFAGAGLFEQNIKYERRSHVGLDLLIPTIEKTKKIKLMINSTVTKVLLKHKKCVGVEYLSGPFQLNVDTQSPNYVPIANPGVPDIINNPNPLPSIQRIYAKHEVILCAGTFVTPQILMLSGIGPSDQLTQYGIPVVVDSPGVGQGLQDHMETNWSPFFQAYNPWNEPSDTNVNASDPSFETEIILSEYDANGNGSNPCQSNGTGIIQFDWYTGLDNPMKPTPIDPDYHWELTPDGASGNPSFNSKSWIGDFSSTNNANLLYGVPGQFYGGLVENSYCQGRGSLTLQSADPRVPLKINLGFTPQDAAVLALAIVQMRQIIASGPWNNLGQYNTIEMVPGAYYDDPTLDGYNNGNPKSLVSLIYSSSDIGHHASSTCAMGKKSDPNTPLDSKLKVKGIKNLRVMDLSGFPLLCSDNPCCPVYMFAEKGADILIKKYSKKTNKHHRH